MSKKKLVFLILLAADIVLGVIFVSKLMAASEKLSWAYYESDDVKTSSVLDYLEWEDFGTAAMLSRSYRIGAEVDEADEELFKLGEYADMLFYGKIYEESGMQQRAQDCDGRRSEIRKDMADYAAVLDKMDDSLENAIERGNR